MTDPPNKPATVATSCPTHEASSRSALICAAAGATGGRATGPAAVLVLHPVGRSVSLRLMDAARAASAATCGGLEVGVKVVAVVVVFLGFTRMYTIPPMTRTRITDRMSTVRLF